MNKARILKGLLWIVNESGGILNDLDLWLGELKKVGLVDIEQREVEPGLNLPFIVITDAGRERLNQ